MKSFHDLVMRSMQTLISDEFIVECSGFLSEKPFDQFY